LEDWRIGGLRVDRGRQPGVPEPVACTKIRFLSRRNTYLSFIDNYIMLNSLFCGFLCGVNPLPFKGLVGTMRLAITSLQNLTQRHGDTEVFNHDLHGSHG